MIKTKKNPDTSEIVKKRDCNAKITEIESKIPGISDLVTGTALTAVEMKIPDVSNLVKKYIMMQKYQPLKINILLQLITINLLNILLLIT